MLNRNQEGPHGEAHRKARRETVEMVGAVAFLVLMFSGFLLATNLRVNRSVVVSNDTAELVEQRLKKSTPCRRKSTCSAPA